MRIFLTGATGFIGSVAARQLVAQGHEVVTIARSPEKAGDLARLGVKIHKGDITEKESLRVPMTGADALIHMAGWYKVGTRDKSLGQQINVDGTRNVLEMMRDLGIPRGVYTSTLAVFSDTKGRLVDETYRYDGPHISEYDRTKWVAHYEVADPMIKAGLPLIIVQPGLVYGPGDTSSLRPNLIAYLKRQLPFMPLGTAFCWGHVEDTARAHWLALEKGKPGESYIIAGPMHPFADALRLAERITGIPAPRILVAPSVMRLMSGAMSLVERIVPLPETFTSESLRVTGGTTYIGNNEKAWRELGYEPRPLEDGLRETLRHEARLLGMDVKF